MRARHKHRAAHPGAPQINGKGNGIRGKKLPSGVKHVFGVATVGGLIHFGPVLEGIVAIQIEKWAHLFVVHLF